MGSRSLALLLFSLLCVAPASCGGQLDASEGPGGASGCELEVMGWSELPAASAGARVGGPAVLWTGTSFVVAYNAVTPDGAERTVSVLPVQADGHPGTEENVSFSECKGKSSEAFEPTMAGAWDPLAGAGLLGFSRPSCPLVDAPLGGGFGLVQVNAKGGVVVSNVIYLKPTLPPPEFAQQGALSQGVDAEQFRMSFVRGGVTWSFPLVGVNPQPGLTGIDNFFGAVAGDSRVSNVAFSLTAREGGLFVNATSGTLKDGSEGSMLRVVKGGASYFKRPAAKEMALRLAGDKIVTVSRSKNDQIEGAVLKEDGTQLFPAGTGINAPIEASSLGFDAAVLGDRAFVAVGKAGGIRVHGLPGLGAAQAGPPVELGVATMPPLAKFEGRQLAMAAGGGRVAVAWVSQPISAGSSAGGVVVLKCE